MIEKPWDLEEAELILGLCDRWHKLPSEVLAEDSTMLKLLSIYAAANPPEEGLEDGTDG